ncbi:MAG: Gfo/Idh/MocA family oxidoreductase [Clostridia bacterium]|nr:Gfo/Idh/MocA family oxidoreductase [Clostridia bacterium]MDY2900859.1 Gfo/Idh/MocA family oxidoreductase [Christensenellaceae bacterium]
MKKIKFAIVGFGNRGQIYGDYTLSDPDNSQVVAVVDTNPYKLKIAKEKYGLCEGQLFESLEAFLRAGSEADVVVNATMDQYHYETAIAILNGGYHMLMEKPIVAEREKLLEIERLAKEKSRLVFVCHVLRYTPFYRKIKQLVNDGEIGEIMSMEMNEHVWNPHFLTSYIRGKWSSEEECGSGFLLAKCCHDADLISWLNNAAKPVNVASFGSRSQFVPGRKPAEATEYCWNCPLERHCKYSAKILYYDYDTMPFLLWDRMNKPYDEITKEEKEAFLKENKYGKCAYDCGGDLVDRQNMIVNFDNGSIATFDLTGGATRPDRYIHIVGQNGEIEGKLSEDKFVLRKYVPENLSYREEVVDVSKEIVINVPLQVGGHSGGDYAIMHDLIGYLNGDRSSLSITSIEDSVNGHLMVYAAEESRKTGKIITVRKNEGIL